MILHVFWLQMLLFPVHCPKHFSVQLIAAIVALTCTISGDLQAVYYRLDNAVIGSISFCMHLIELLMLMIHRSVNNQSCRLWLCRTFRVWTLDILHIFFSAWVKPPTTKDQSLYPTNSRYTIWRPLSLIQHTVEEDYITIKKKLRMISYPINNCK